MKNTKKIVSLVLAICMLASLAISASAANTVDASGGTGTSSVTLSSTADGSIGGDPAATKMSVTVPTVLPIAVGTDGTVSTATDAKIVNNSFGAVKVANVSIEAAQGWNLTAFGDKATLAKEKVDSNKFGFQIALGNGEKKLTDNKNASKQTLLDAAVEGCYMSGVGDTSANSIGIAYDAIVTPVSEAVTNTAIASVLFIIAWDAVYFNRLSHRGTRKRSPYLILGGIQREEKTNPRNDSCGCIVLVASGQRIGGKHSQKSHRLPRL